MSAKIAAVVALLALALPAWANHNPSTLQVAGQEIPLGEVFPARPGPTEPVLVWPEIARDGYLVQITRVEARVFDIRVLHQQELVTFGNLPVYAQYALDPVGIVAKEGACDHSGTCGNVGLWLHSLRAAAGCSTLPSCEPSATTPIEGLYLPQTHALSGDGTTLRVTLGGEPFSPAFNGAVNAVVTLDNGHWVRGFYNVAKLAVPLDALDAFPEPIRIV